MRGVFDVEVLANQPFCRNHYRMVLRAAGFPRSSPGQFIQIQCRRTGEQNSLQVSDWPEHGWPKLTQADLTDTEPLLRRPLSLAGRIDRPGELAELTVIYRVAGTGTRWLAGVEAGEGLSILGPLGNSFAIQPSAGVAALVGGGVGIPPLMYLASALAEAGKEVVAFCGARTANLLPLTLVPSARIDHAGVPTPCVAEFASAGAVVSVSTDDGSVGHKGYVSEAFSRWLGEMTSPAGRLTVYSCGPESMMRAVAKVCAAGGIDCQLALERHMACGMGTCQSCAVKIRSTDDRGWAFKLCCADGPVFDAKDVLW